MASDVSTKKALPFPSPASAETVKPAPKPASQPPRSASQPGKSFSDELAKADKPSTTPMGRGPDKAPTKAPAEAAQTAQDRPAKASSPGDEAQQAPDGAVAAAGAGTKAVGGKKVELKPLKDAATSNKQAINDAPAVAFLTGKLEKLTPDSIPALVSNNVFLATALVEDDLTNFFTSQETIADLIDALGLPEQVAKDAERLGLDLDTEVSPSEFLKSIGVDPQRVFAELKVLKDNLLTGGVAAYMKRAGVAGHDSLRDVAMVDERLDVRNSGRPQPQPQAGTMPVAPALPGAPSLSPRPVQQATPGDLTGGVRAGARPDALFAEGLSLETIRAGLEGRETDAMNPEAQAWLAQLGAMAATPAPAALELAEVIEPAEAKIEAVAANVVELADPADVERLTAGADLTTPRGEATMHRASPTMHRATHDAWAAMGERLRGVETRVAADAVGGAPTARAVAGLTLEEQLMSRQMTPAAVVQPPGAAALAPADLSRAVVPSGSVREVDPRLLQDLKATMRTESLETVVDPSQGARSAPLALASGGGPKDGVLKGDLGPVRVEDLRLTAPQIAVRGVDEFAGRNPRDEGRGGDEGGGELDLGSRGNEALLSSSSPAAGPHRAEAAFAHALKVADPTVMTSEQRAHMVQQVIDRATTLTHEGGGTVRLDLGSPELGHLEMAIRMNDDRLEMKIMTGSDRVRDVMMADLTRLRDALAVQNVQLGNVEVGVGGRNPSAFAGFAGQSPFERRQAPSDERGGGERRGSIAASGLERLGGSRRGTLPHLAAAGAFNQNGRLAIRA